MDGSDLGEFFRQPFVLQIGLLLLVVGVLYVGMTAYIFRRAAMRRSKRRVNKSVMLATQPVTSSGPLGNFLGGQLPDRPNPPAAWTVPAELRNLPEPDLDMLASPLLIEEGQDSAPVSEASTSEAPAESVEAIPAGAEEWITAVVPVEEADMSPVSVDNNSDADSAAGNIQMGDAVEVMRVWRDINDGSLIIQMGSQRYRKLSDIQNQDLSRRFVAVVRELWAIVNNGPRPSGQINTNDPIPGIAAPTNSQGGMKARMGLMSSEPEPAAKPHMLKQVARQAAGQTGPTPPDVPQGIATAIEDFLQFKLSSTPQFATRSIHFRIAHDLGIRIEVDGHYYDAIAEVVDPDVREFLLALMREWEARH